MKNMKFLHSTVPLVLFFFFYCYIGSNKFLVSAEVEPNHEAQVLLSIKAGLFDPLDRLKDWKFPEKDGSVHCNWTGVKCNFNGAVKGLDLSRMNLSGVVSYDIQRLKNLTSLNLSCNEFSSPLPKSLTNLSALQIIDISQNYFLEGFPVGLGMAVGLISLNASGNNFSGFLPQDLGNAMLLESLDLRGNFFEGSIPNSYKNLGKLKFLGLSGNNLTGQIPWELGKLKSLETLVLGYNEFEGGIPAEFGNLTNLRYFDLAVGNLGGSIPAELGNLKLLNAIFLYQNNFHGKIPPEIGKMTSLQQLDLSDNNLSGEIPPELANLKNLQVLNLMQNHLSGSVPAGIAELPKLETLELWNNSLSGFLPDKLGLNSPLQWLDISSNLLSGPIPSHICSKCNLTKLILFNNAFSGPIPASLSTCTSLIRVRLQNNLLSGTIPAGFGKLGRLQRLEIANNILTGEIPSDISFSSSLSFIDLSRNNLQSSLPSSILTIPSLQDFLASENNFVGEIPDQFQDCPSLSVLDLSSNHFVGTIPTSIASCDKMVTLNLRNNGLTGQVPSTIATMPTLAVLDLSNNSLTGNIPEGLGNSPALEMFNVSHNKLEGPVPTNGVLRTINPDELIGNPGLCGGVLPPCTHNAAFISSQKSLHTKHIITGWVIGISSLLSLAFVGFGIRSFYKRWRSIGSCFEERFEMGKGEWPWRLMAFQRLGFASNDILNCIKESNIVGMGATGVVYKAEIHRLNTVVAVKKLSKSVSDIEIGGGEVNLLGRLRHRNIVRLLGFLHNNREAMLIYEYMQNGSLCETLHGKQAGRVLVDWVSRYNVALGVAQGLAYLHHDCHPPVIHRDVKSSNILLNAHLEARIADFGLAKMMIKNNETVSMVAGSYGYIAPEYGYTLKVDEKSDIYSFGVVLMELLTGKQPLDPEFGESVDIVEWIRRKIRDNRCLEEVLDLSVGTSKHVKEEMLLVLRIAIVCTAILPKDRPSMRDVLTMLGEAKPRRKNCSSTAGASDASNKDKPVFNASPVHGLV